MQPGFIPDSGHYRPMKGLRQLDLVCMFCGTSDRQYFGVDPNTPIVHNYDRPKRYEELKSTISNREAKEILAKQQRKEQRELAKVMSSKA